MASDMRSRAPDPEDGDGLSKQTINKLRVGMSQREVDAVFGQPGTAAKRFDTEEVTAALPGGPGNAGERWHTATMEGRVFVWAKGSDKVLVGYNTQPGARGGTVVGVIALFDGEASELIPLPGR